MAETFIPGLPEDECLACAEDPTHAQFPLKECPKSLRPCGHHCNCSWVHDCCHWCGGETSEDGESFVIPEPMEASRG